MKLIIMALGVFSVASAFAQTGEECFKFQNNTITRYICDSDSVIIPETIKTQRVLTIGAEAFADNRLIAVTIPEGVITIEDEAFRHNQLTSIILPESIKTVGVAVFSSNKITTFVLPKNLTTIPKKMFYKNSLKSVSIPSGIGIIGVSAFADNQIESVTFEKNNNSGLSIESSAFFNNQISLLNLPDRNFFVFGDSSFRNNRIESIQVEGGVLISKIGANAFKNNQLRELPKVSFGGFNKLDEILNSVDSNVKLNTSGIICFTEDSTGIRKSNFYSKRGSSHYPAGIAGHGETIVGSIRFPNRHNNEFNSIPDVTISFEFLQSYHYQGFTNYGGQLLGVGRGPYFSISIFDLESNGFHEGKFLYNSAVTDYPYVVNLPVSCVSNPY